MPNASSASENTSSDSSARVESDSQDQANKAEPAMVNPYRYSKENVKKTTGWSSFRRVSDNVTTGKEGGSIISTKSATFTTDVSGSITGLGISTGSSKTSTVGYSLNADANSTSYMGYRVKYNIETGTHVRTDVATGKKKKSKYTVKSPAYGEYKLIKQ